MSFSPIWKQSFRSLRNLSLEFISLILRGFLLSSRVFYLENGRATIPCDKKRKNLSKTPYENKQNKLQTQVKKEPNPEKAKIVLEQIDWDPQTLKVFIDFCNTPWFRSFVNLDPRTYLKEVKVPTLALFGSLDLQVPPKENLPDMEKAISKKTPFTSKVFPNLNHLFQTATTGSPEEYFQIEEPLSPELLDTLVEWIESQSSYRVRVTLPSHSYSIILFIKIANFSLLW